MLGIANVNVTSCCRDSLGVVACVCVQCDGFIAAGTSLTDFNKMTGGDILNNKRVCVLMFSLCLWMLTK